MPKERFMIYPEDTLLIQIKEQAKKENRSVNNWILNLAQKEIERQQTSNNRSHAKND